MRAFKRTTEPAVEPVIVGRLRSALVIDSNDRDGELKLRIQEATDVLEREFGTALITQTWQLQLDGFPAGGCIRLPHPPLQAVTSIQYVDAAGDTQTWDAADYRVDAFSEPGRITPAYDKVYPITRAVMGAVTITYTAGYGDAESDVPFSARAAVQLLAADLFRNPETVLQGVSITELPSSLSVERLMRPLTGYKFG